MVTRNRDLTRRMNWFDRQFLRAQDFADDQDYALDRRHRHNRLLHTEGVADGLAVTGEKEGTTITVAPGMALDAAGRELVMLEGITETLPSSLDQATVAEVYLVYEEQAVEPSTDPGVTGQATRIREAARVAFRPVTETASVPVSPTPGPAGQVPGVLLATLQLAGGKLKSEPANGVRRQAGALLQEAALPELLLKVAQKPQADWPRLSGKAANTIGVDGSLHLENNQVMLGAGETPSRLHFDASTKLLTLTGPTGVAVQGPTSGQDALDVNGSLKVASGSNPVRITGAWSGFPDGANNRAEISNDTGTYKTLMIVGNKSGDGKTRKVSVWDRLEVNGAAHVNGSAAVTGSMTIGGALTPSVGNDAAHGIQFPANPAGGSGDEAYIRYAARGTDTSALTIGVANDPDDRISFVQSGRERLAIFGGMPHLGTIDGTSTQPGTVLGGLGFWGHGVQHGQLAFRAGSGFELVDMSADGPRLAYAKGSRPHADLTLRNAYLTDVIHTPDATISAKGRLHIAGDELLYVLNKSGMVVGREWGGNGNLTAQGSVNAANVGTNGFPADSGYPDGWGGGVHTWDVFAEGTIGAGKAKVVKAGIRSDGTVFGVKKPFIIDHPQDPENRSLVHAAIEGPELAVYYRGEDELTDGRATVDLPGYFEALVRPEGRTVHVTPILEDDEPVSALAASRVKEGRFTVRTTDGSEASHSFSWVVYGVRSDVEKLEVEVMKTREPVGAGAGEHREPVGSAS
jgi:hypothetical protein